MKLKTFFIYLVSLSSMILLSTLLIEQVNASIGLELKNEEAFEGKNNYFLKATFYNGTTYTSHQRAFQNAVDRMNAISGSQITIRPSPTTNAHIKMSSVNDSSFSWYGHASWNTNGATLRLNEATTSKAGFESSHYNKTAMHELGHAFYMVHQHSDVNSVMKSGKYSYNDYSNLDKFNIIYKY